ncbi:hypothetical protein [Lachnoanaerobaculum gingivalis]|uniref:hypothetical protein n=1 Tax=Lachnoanaerobaculum gingivalis TaxID=2490855 RepID=UPI0028D1AD03|nr:hypothetical protein [Lachnoanaerobaculum gingivalis]
MHRILYFSGIFSSVIMLFISILLWFKMGVRKAFSDILSYGSKKKWMVDRKMQNTTMPLRKINSRKVPAKRSIYDTGKNNKNTDETILLKNYHGQILNNHNENTNFEIIEEINLIAGGR